MLQSMQMRDVNGNGKVDQVTVVFDDTLAAYSAGIAPWTLTNVPSGGSLSSVVVNGTTATLTITEGLGAANTAVGTFTSRTRGERGRHPRRERTSVVLRRHRADGRGRTGPCDVGDAGCRVPTAGSTG